MDRDTKAFSRCSPSCWRRISKTAHQGVGESSFAKPNAAHWPGTLGVIGYGIGAFGYPGTNSTVATNASNSGYA